MSEDNTPKQPKKKIKTSTPVSESQAMRITEQDNNELQDVMEASEFNRYLSPLERKLIKKSLYSNLPLDLKAINQMVLEKEDGGYLQRLGKPKKGDDDEDDDITKDDNKNLEGDKDNAGKEDCSNDGDVHATIVDDNTNVPEDYDIKDPFIKSKSTKATEICISCSLIPCKLEVYGDLLKKMGKDIDKKNYTTIVLSGNTATKSLFAQNTDDWVRVSAFTSPIGSSQMSNHCTLTLAVNTLDSSLPQNTHQTMLHTTMMTMKKSARTVFILPHPRTKMEKFDNDEYLLLILLFFLK